MRGFQETAVLAAVIIMLAGAASAQLSGSLSGTLGPGDYTVVGNIYISAGNSLVMNPGTSLFFEAGRQFDINGYLCAAGTTTDSVKFVPRVPGQSWHGLDFSDSASDSSELEYCLITGSSSSGIDLIRCSPSISHCLIIGNTGNNGGGIYSSYSNSIITYSAINENAANNSGGGIYMSFSDLHIANCEIKDDSSSDGGGIYGENSDPVITYSSIVYNIANMGGGMHFTTESHPVITACIVKNNASNICGAGIWCVTSSCHLTVSSSLFMGNSAGGSAGAIYNYSNSAEISNCYIIGNAAVSSAGAVHCRNEAPKIIRDCVFSNNITEENGGAIMVINSSPVITGCRFEGNFAAYGGGAVSFYESDSGYVSDCVFYNNACLSGGGIETYGSYTTIRKSLFCFNSARDQGGGVCYSNSFSPVMENCTIAENNSRGGGGIHCRGTRLTMLNSIIAGNMGNGGIFFEESSNISISFSDFHDNLRGNFTGAPPHYLGNLTGVNARGDSCDRYYNIYLDPCFNAVWADSGFRLTVDSPCIDAGDPRSPYDPDSTAADMGAFYFRHGFFITLTPQQTPAAIPAVGGQLIFTILVENITREPVNGDFWTEVVLPNGRIYGPLIQASGLTISPGRRVEREVTQYVPGYAPAGLYTYSGIIRILPDSTLIQDSFDFEKFAGETLPASHHSGWAVYGWDNSPAVSAEPFPSGFEFLSPRPNPFNNRTKLTFRLSEGSKVSLAVYDIRGRLIANIAEGCYPAGSFQADFDGSGLSSGVYFARFQAEGYTQTRKLALVK